MAPGILNTIWYHICDHICVGVGVLAGLAYTSSWFCVETEGMSAAHKMGKDTTVFRQINTPGAEA